MLDRSATLKLGKLGKHGRAVHDIIRQLHSQAETAVHCT